jgi:hypothetical protein
MQRSQFGCHDTEARDPPMSAEVLADESRRLISLLPQQQPMRILDRITAIVRGIQIRGVKNVLITEHFFAGHLPRRPIHRECRR